jgi:hypothetical protein
MSNWTLEKGGNTGSGNNYIIAGFVNFALQYILLYNERKNCDTGSEGNMEYIQNFGRKSSRDY